MIDNYKKIKKDKIQNKYGKYKVFLKIKSLYLIGIGPHWITSLIGYFLLLFIFLSIYLFLKDLLIPVLNYFYIVLLFLQSFVFIIIFISNPGIGKKKSKRINEDNKELIYNCYLCYSEYGSNYQHCNDCEICIKSLDHHCNWMGKCIGAYNYYPFFSYLVLIFGFFIYLIFSIFFTIVKLKKMTFEEVEVSF